MPAPAPLKIAILAHVRFPIRAPYKGGMEAHAAGLARALVDRGHEVALFASGDSDPDLPLRAATPVHYEADLPWHDFRASLPLRVRLATVYRDVLAAIGREGFDVVHNNCLHPRPHLWALHRRQPTVTSLHIPPFHTLKKAVTLAEAPWMVKTLTSRQQVPLWWNAPPSTARVVHNGIDLDAWPFVPRGDGSAVWFGRIARTKGPEYAVRAARIAGVPLTLFGVMEEKDHFDAAVAPLLGGDIRYGGHLTQGELAAEAGRASALLFTPMWQEPFGLAAAEAMACGLPVAAFDNGAAREIIGPCGHFAPPGDADALAEALTAALAAPRIASRRRVEARYSMAAMVAGYEAAYGAALDGAALARAA